MYILLLNFASNAPPAKSMTKRQTPSFARSMSEAKSNGVWNKLGYVEKTEKEYVLGVYENGRVRTELLPHEEVEESCLYKVEGTYLWEKSENVCVNCGNKMLTDQFKEYYCPVCE